MTGYPGLRHFKNGISFVSQWTGREHKEMQCVLVSLLHGAVQPAVLRTAVVVIVLIYYSQLQEHTSESLAALQAALDAFHDNKGIFVREGIRDHFNIPKIHQMLHYIDAIESRGSADGYNSESPERLHIDFAKDAYRASNKREYVRQMTVWLGRQEAIAQFTAYLSWMSKPDLDAVEPDPDGNVEDNIDEDIAGEDSAAAAVDEQDEQDAHDTLSHTISIKPGFPHHDLATITHKFKATNFAPLLTTFIRRAYPPPKKPVLPNTTDRFDLYKVITIRRPDIKAAGRVKSVDRVRATPAFPGHIGKKDIEPHFDTVLVRTDVVNEVTQGTILQGMCPVTKPCNFSTLTSFRSSRGSSPLHIHSLRAPPPLLPCRLAYVEWFTPFRAPDPDTKLYSVSRSTRNHVRAADIMPIDNIVSSCHLAPKYGTQYHPAKWTSTNVLAECKVFILNKYIRVATFYEHRIVPPPALP